MKLKPFILLGLCLLAFSCSDRQPTFEMIEPVSIIPMPQSISYSANSFILNPDTKIVAGRNEMRESRFLAEIIKAEFGHELEIISEKPESNFIALINTNREDSTNSEAYNLSVEPGFIKINSSSSIGLFWGIQTLNQAFNQTDHQDGFAVRIQSMKITDNPKFKHRGLLLDCCRHFYSTDVVKKYIKLLSYYKMNVLHWHLTEDQGWRIEIDQYPKLTEVGAWRSNNDGTRYGGFYTKEDIREIVKYASDLNVTIIPEIELPGHSQAAISAYPHLSCEQRQVPVANDWGVFKEIYCAGNDSTFIFIENVLTEVMELFPSDYIHIGGDEAPKYRWEHCSKCQKRIQDEELHDEHGLQSYFISRVEKFLNKNGRKLIGWDEILEGGLSANATVQSWRGMQGGTDAANSKHGAIMSPTSHCYLDYPLDAINLEKVFNFNPIPDSMPEDLQKYILGGEVNMWTEHVPNEDNLDSKVFPRMLALSEVLWNGIDGDYVEFKNRVYDHYALLDSMGVNYGAEAIPISMKTVEDSLFLNAEVEGIELEYRTFTSLGSVNNDLYVNQSSVYLPYTGPIFCNDAVRIEARAVRDSVEYGETIEQTFIKRAKIIGEPKYETTYADSYNGGGVLGLIDGKLGSLNFRDGNWQGIQGKNFSVTFELQEGQTLNSVSTNFYHYNNSWIFRPEEFTISISNDGIQWTRAGGDQKAFVEANQRGKSIVNMNVKMSEPITTKYLKIQAVNIGKVPHWHEAAGSSAWLFMDEIIIK